MLEAIRRISRRIVPGAGGYVGVACQGSCVESQGRVRMSYSFSNDDLHGLRDEFGVTEHANIVYIRANEKAFA